MFFPLFQFEWGDTELRSSTRTLATRLERLNCGAAEQRSQAALNWLRRW